MSDKLLNAKLENNPGLKPVKPLNLLSVLNSNNQYLPSNPSNVKANEITSPKTQLDLISKPLEVKEKLHQIQESQTWLNNHPEFINLKKDVPEKINDQVIFGLTQVPKPILEDLYNSGYRIIIPKDIISYDSNLARTPIKADPYNRTYANVDGLTSKEDKLIVLPQYHYPTSSTSDNTAENTSVIVLNKIANKYMEESVCHEVGHAWDKINELSLKDPFDSFYKIDKTINSTNSETDINLKTDINYFKNRPDEAFAQIFADTILKPPYTSRDYIKTALPHCSSSMAGIIKSFKTR